MRGSEWRGGDGGTKGIITRKWNTQGKNDGETSEARRGRKRKPTLIISSSIMTNILHTLR
jgi:hypothetical protein